MFIFDLVLLSMAAAYAATLVVLSCALAAYRPATRRDVPPLVSVIMAARNESSQIIACLEALAAQHYDPARFEVIVVDDRSDDDTATLAESFKERLSRLTVLRIAENPTDMAPKKNAITAGIRASNGDIILCTDADCRPDPNWIRSTVELFTDEVGMVIGFSPVQPGRTWSMLGRFAALDGLALGALAASSAAFGKPLTATGRSLAYRRQTFDDVGGFSRIARFVSGDDDLLVQLVRKTRWRISYNFGAHVPTGSPSSFRQFMHQRIRHASKGRHYTWSVVAILALVYVFNVSVVVYPPMATVWFSNNQPWYAWLCKAGAELLFLSVAATRFRVWPCLTAFPLVAAMHPLYVVVFGLWGQLGRFEWKQTRHSALQPTGGPAE